MTFILLVIFFYVDFKKSFPVIISVLFILNNYAAEFGVPLPGIGLLETGFIFTILFFIKSLFYLRSINKDVLFKMIAYLLTSYFVFIVIRHFSDSLTLLQTYKSARPLIIQLFLFSSIVYFKNFGTSKFYEILYWGTLLFLFVWSGYIYIIPDRIIGTTLGIDALHSAVVGLAVSYIVAFNLVLRPGYHRRWLVYIIIFVSSIVPLIGMSRGGIIALIIVFFSYSFLAKKIKRFLLTIVLLPVFFLSANYIIVSVIPNNISYRHLGSNDLFELLSRSENVEESIGVRIIRWNYAISVFEDNPFVGGGFTHSTISSGLAEHKYKDLWQTHNYYLAILAGGGLFLFIPNLLLVFFGIKKSLYIFLKRENINYRIFGIILFFNVININFTNNYFKFFWSGPYIWVLFGAGLFELTKKKYYIES